MSGTITTIDTPLEGTAGASAHVSGGDGTPGQTVAETAAPFSSTDYTALIPLGDQLTPFVMGGAGGFGYFGADGANGVATSVYDANFDETTTWTPGQAGGAGGSGADGGNATVQMSNDLYGAAGATAQGAFTLNATTRGGTGGNGDAGGVGGGGGYNGDSNGTNPNTGAPTTVLVEGAAGGSGGAGGAGGGGGAADTAISGLVGFASQGTSLTVSAYGANGGIAGFGAAGGIGGETSAGGQGGAGGAGGSATAILTGSQLEDDDAIRIDISAIGGNGGAGEFGGAGGESRSVNSMAEPNTVIDTANGADGGAGGAGGDASAQLTGNTLTAPYVTVELYATMSTGGEGGAGGSGGTGVSTPTITYNNGETGAAGIDGAAGAAQLDFTDNIITVGTPIPGDSATTALNELDLTLGIQSTAGPIATPVNLNGAAGGNLVFSGNQFIGTGSSTLELSIAGAGSVTIDTANNTISIDNSAANSLTGFTNFTLDDNDIFVAGPGNYVVLYASDPDTLVYTPTSGNVTLEGVTPSNLVLDFSGFGAGFTAQTVQDATTISGGNTYIHIPDAGSIELLGFTGAIPTADIEIEPACFLAGTRIATPDGEVPVEALRAGDLVRTASGAHRKLRWVGTGRTLVTPRNRDRATPVVIRKGALADFVPHRDLFITRGHSLFLEGVLIPVEELINHRSIAWVHTARMVTYYHLELDSHDVVLAEGAAAETYREDANCPVFLNAVDRPWTAPAPPCAPVLHDHPTVKRLWRVLSERAGPPDLLFPDLLFTDDPDLHLLADGERLDAISVADGIWRFRLKRPVRALRIVSRHAIPAMTGLAQDQRRLGVALRRIALAQGGRHFVADWDRADLTDGFHGAEPAERHRWTDGDAALPPAMTAWLQPGAIIALHVNGKLPYPVSAAAAHRATAA